jgi:hypothetical protein
VRSRLLEANAWHHRSDVVSSIVVLVGVGATLAGFRFMDAVAAVLVALLIGHMGLRMIWQSAHELIDTGVEPEEQARMLAAVRAIDGVRDAHDLRTRHMGGVLLADVHVLVAPRISVSEGHRISESACRALRAINVSSATSWCMSIPRTTGSARRAAICRGAPPCWSACSRTGQEITVRPAADDITLHYLDGTREPGDRAPDGPIDTLAQVASLSEKLVKRHSQGRGHRRGHCPFPLSPRDQAARRQACAMRASLPCCVRR